MSSLQPRIASLVYSSVALYTCRQIGTFGFGIHVMQSWSCHVRTKGSMKVEVPAPKSCGLQLAWSAALVSLNSCNSALSIL